MSQIDRNCIRGDNWEFCPVDDFNIFESFDCGDADLNEFIQKDAALHRKERIAETYVFRAMGTSIPIAFASLLNDRIELATNRLKRRIHNRLRKYDDFPAVKIGRLGVRLESQSGNVGSIILDNLKLLFTRENRTGCRFLIVDAYKNPRVINFYHKNDFSIYPSEQNDTNTILMFFDLIRYQLEPAQTR